MEAFARIDDFLAQDGDGDNNDEESGIRHPFECDAIWPQSEEEDLDFENPNDESLFPLGLDFADLDAQLEKVGYNLQLLNLNWDSSESRAPAQAYSSEANHTQQSSMSQTICRHLLSGGCYRSDCWFSHDLSNTVCKYFLQGFCSNGDECPFLHDTHRIVSSVYDSVHPDIPQQYDDNDGTHQDFDSSTFPSLSTLDAKTPAKFDFWGPTLAFNEVLKREAPALSDAARKEYTGDGGFAKTVAKGTAARYFDDSQEGRKIKLSGVKWLGTGGDMNSLYKKHRKEAGEAAVERNRMFQRAAEAYRSGNMAAAKKFSQEGHRLDGIVSQYNAKASSDIFQTRNASSAVSDTERMLDLHGLHGNEAIYFLDESLARLKKERFVGVVSVVTGTGHHSQSSIAKIAPLIRDYLRKEGLRYKEATLEDGRGGLFVLNLS
ncbi:hypothetical protein CcCBS67573_g01310 [Chytriomyces confervae]|uniref:Smr domain-containing protein n=1 Tax=Chytriomyces confervae TaxID=246404 RepID=A0A507FR00_9FUNG|nr:hypothetical protein HDU80_009031 [Chytriomyces hyalinus]TPX77437.1 hypothetical protein CcCBS67573_g01310 [Chytriomyces confervae]